MKRSLILTAFSFLVLAQLGLAQMPQTISYQGVLRDPGTKEIVPNDNYDLTFRLYDASTGGAEWWSETHPGVPVADGIFNVILGSNNSFISTDPRTRFEIPYWLEIDVGTLTLSPRIELTAVPYSIAARSVQGYRNVFPSNGHVGIGTASPGAKLHIDSPNADGIILTDSSSGLYSASLINFETVGGSLNLNDATGAVQARIRGYEVDGVQAFFMAGNVGIGTAAPSQKLDVNGTVLANGFALNNLNTKISSLTTNNIDLITSNAVRVRIDPSGNVGIGTTAPSVKLEVAGGANIQGNLVALGDVSTLGTLTAVGDASTGSLAVSGDASVQGNLTVTGTTTIPATTRWYSISASEFMPAMYDLTYLIVPYYIYPTSGSGSLRFHAGVHLPDGAVIKEFQVGYDDSDATSNISVYLEYTAGNASGANLIKQLTSTGSPGTATMSNALLNHTVNNSTNSYNARAEWTIPATSGAIKLRNVRIRYEITAPLP